eukprot:scaffold46056_cov27-Cyclotella_meneghiniana.AAC.2
MESQSQGSGKTASTSIKTTDRSCHATLILCFSRKRCKNNVVPYVDTSCWTILPPVPLLRYSMFGSIQEFPSSLTLPMSHYKYDEWLVVGEG